MDIAAMHVWFRQYAQQMGMQNTRMLLPEQIDLLINTSITDVTNQIIKEHIGLTNDRVAVENTKIGQVNALRTLYKVDIIDMSPSIKDNVESRTFNFSLSDRLTGKMSTSFDKVSNTNLIPKYMYLVDFSLNYKKVKDNKGYTGKNGITPVGRYDVLTYDENGDLDIAYDSIDIKSNIGIRNVELLNGSSSGTTLFFTIDDVDSKEPKLICTHPAYDTLYLGLTYKDNKGRYVLTPKHTNDIVNPLDIVSYEKQLDYVQPEFDDEGLETTYFPVRIIEDSLLAETLNDFILKNRLRSPIITTYNNDRNNTTFDLYIDKFNKVIDGNGDVKYVLPNGLVPYKLRMAYIAKPAEVRYAEDVDGVNVNCDLPEFLHVDILKHAVDLWRMAISNSSLSSQSGSTQQQPVNPNYQTGNQQV